MTARTNRSLALIAACVTIACAALASGLTPADDGSTASGTAQRPVTPSATTAGSGDANGASGRGLLAGPKVSDEAEAGQGGYANGGMMARARANRAAPVRPRAWFRIVNSLDLDDAQRVQVRAIAEEFESNVRAFQQAHGDEIELLQRKVNEGGDRAGRALRQEIDALRAQAPKPEPYMERIWSILTSEQQGALKERLEAMRRDSRNGAPGDRRPGAGGRRGGPGAAPGAGSGGPGGPSDRPGGSAVGPDGGSGGGGMTDAPPRRGRGGARPNGRPAQGTGSPAGRGAPPTP